MNRNAELTHEVERTLGGRVPGVEIVLAERPAPGRVRVFIDHPGGVDLDLCERVSRELSPLRDRYALEVSSPGLDRPLVTARHFARVVGRRVAVRTDRPLDGRRRFEGRLNATDDAGIEIEQDGQPVRIGYSSIARGHLVYESGGGAA
jgi:ribosome maturation factor RimP